MDLHKNPRKLNLNELYLSQFCQKRGAHDVEKNHYSITHMLPKIKILRSVTKSMLQGKINSITYPLCKFYNDTTSIKVTAIQTIYCIFSISWIAKLLGSAAIERKNIEKIILANGVMGMDHMHKKKKEKKSGREQNKELKYIQQKRSRASYPHRVLCVNGFHKQ